VSAVLVATVPAVERSGDFSTAGPDHSPAAAAAAVAGDLDPRSNTGPKGGGDARLLSEPQIDWLTVKLKPGALRKSGCSSYAEFVAMLFGLGDQVVVRDLDERAWQFYRLSAVMIDRTGKVAGKIGVQPSDSGAPNAGEMCISLSGNGCRHMPQDDRSRWILRNKLARFGAKVCRIDIAVDDIAGNVFTMEKFLAHARNGDFATNGRPPKWFYLETSEDRDGETLYVGRKGHKQLCIYEKGKQLGAAASRYVRVELRLYGNKLELALDVVTDLAATFGGAYPLLEQFVMGEVAQLVVKQHQAVCSIEAAVEFSRQQQGTWFHTVRDCIGEEGLHEMIRRQLSRPGLPGRFQGHTGDLREAFREWIAVNWRNEDGQDARDDRQRPEGRTWDLEER
jgi:DNA relaxase NicK